MAGAFLERELTGARAEFALARREDDSEIRRLLRETPMAGRISLSLEREPNYFADGEIPGETRQTIVARDAGKIVCVGSCVHRDLFVNGEPRRIGYLGGMRLAAGHAGRFDILRRGYECFRELQADNPASFYFTSIAADNLRARSFLEAGVRGMPKYEFVSEYATVIMPAKRGDFSRAETATFESDGTRQFAPVWSSQKMAAFEKLGLSRECFVSVRNKTAALWDQRSFKQTVVRGYSGWLRFARPVMNLVGLLKLPHVGEVLSNAFVCGVSGLDASTHLELVSMLRAAAAARGIRFITLGLAEKHPRLAAVLKSIRCRVYRSRIYLVDWKGIGGTAADLDGRIVSPEVAFL
jgi:hypothetical protein